MDRYDCGSSLTITIKRWAQGGTQEVRVKLRHHKRAEHLPYVSVDMPAAALALIHEHLEVATPGDLVAAVQALDGCAHVTAAQVHRAWVEMSEILWKRHPEAIPSAVALLKEYAEAGEVDDFVLDVPDGVTAIAWGLPKLAQRVRLVVKEVAMDATCEFRGSAAASFELTCTPSRHESRRARTLRSCRGGR
jgi:hypothetical protein